MNLDAFKAYDIRGVYPTEVSQELANFIGIAFAKYTRKKLSKTDNDSLTFAVGGDMRTSTPSLKKHLVECLINQNVNVLDIGMCTTPMLNFAVNSKNLHGGIMISASHNPKEYNAFKVIGSDGVQLSNETGLDEIKKIVESETDKIQDTNNKKRKETVVAEDMVKSDKLKVKSKDDKIQDANNKKQNGVVEEADVLDSYIKHLTSLVKLKGTKNVVIDCGNGVGGISAAVLQQYCNSTAFLYKEPNGNFPNHNADPHDLNNFKDLQNAVIKQKADLGVFYDGDADRAYFVDELGKIVMADIAFCILADYELTNYEYKNNSLYHDLRFTKAIKDVGKKHNAKTVMMRVGNPFYKYALKQQGGVMAGEFSGHIMYKSNYCIDDGLFVTLKMLEVLENTEKTLSQLVKQYTKYFSSKEMSYKLKTMESANKVLDEVKQKYSNGESVELDGVYIQYKDWWFNLRKSGTEPKVRLRLEANSKELLDKKTKELTGVIEGYV